MIIEDEKGLFPFELDYIGRGEEGRRLKKPFRIVQYAIPIAELQEEVYGRTSVVAKHTPGKDGASQFDKGTLSADEVETFNNLCKAAANEVATVMMPFLPNTRRAYIYNKGYVVPQTSVKAGEYVKDGGVLYLAMTDTHTNRLHTEDFEQLEKDVSHTVHFICKKAIDVYENSLQLTEKSVMEMLVTYIMKEWFAIALPERWEQYEANYQRARENLRFNLNMLDRPVRGGHPF